MLLPRIKEHRHLHELVSTAVVLRGSVLVELGAVLTTLPVVVHDQGRRRLLITADIFGSLGLDVEVAGGAGLRRTLYRRFEGFGVGTGADYDCVTARISVELVAHFPRVKVKEVLLLWIRGGTVVRLLLLIVEGLAFKLGGQLVVIEDTRTVIRCSSVVHAARIRCHALRFV